MALVSTQPTVPPMAPILDQALAALPSTAHGQATIGATQSGGAASITWRPSSLFSLTSYADHAWGAGGWHAGAVGRFTW